MILDHSLYRKEMRVRLKFARKNSLRSSQNYLIKDAYGDFPKFNSAQIPCCSDSLCSNSDVFKFRSDHIPCRSDSVVLRFRSAQIPWCSDSLVFGFRVVQIPWRSDSVKFRFSGGQIQISISIFEP